ncbi:rootletin-like isoform X1 [Camellia sinensis]|uniref:rootletin-like isoform X1 n=1 Tax=Camellia sinensis TaxID=4442 RepID=UPI001036A197|nr:rootletin-like isoform X1 [Camellia sinensis]XP_028107605.1 rootletin-like isoform X2 [Camellia sinensis]XP_028107606.1 rootletin-like isoform X1 [Camellia sinensis]XP_028107607.1 rootletin-like isoform X1 [Camellia sinensis]XP_028107608.1 rootletin-like isoform X1 [Camellia sinensis]
MSRIAKWKIEKTKVKVVFRLQFHATHVPQAGWDKLFISFVPADSGKATAKTTKTNVRNGTCKWGDPIYETTRLLQDSKSKQYDEKLYKFVVAMGSSRSSILGEASINLADYADALKPSVISLSLHGCNSGTILHVTVQLLTSKTGFREFEQQRELRERGLQTGTDLKRHDDFGSGKASSSEEIANDQMDKVNARVRFRPESKELPTLEEEAGLPEDSADSAAGFDGSSHTSESLYAEKHDTSSTHENDSLKSTVSGDLNGLSNCQSPQIEKGDTSDHRILLQRSSDWVQGWSSDYSMDNDLSIAYEENSRLRASLEVAESSIVELKLEVSSLQSHADEIGIETQRFAQQLSAEVSSGEQLANEVSVIKSECSKLKDDLERLKNLKSNPQFVNRETSNTNQDHLFEGIQLRWLKGILLVEDKIRELQNKLYLSFHDRDLRFLPADLEALLIVLQQLKQGNGEAISLLKLPSESTNVEEIREMSSCQSEQFVTGNGFDVDLYQLPDMLHCLSIPGLVSREPDSIGATDAMEGKIFELLRELDEAKTEREGLVRKMNQMECYYEALIQELEENQKQMLGELHNLRNEHSTCLYTIATTRTEMESMCQNMNEQILKLTEERRDLDSISKELERRAITSEAALRRARLNYSIAVGQLQKDLDLLSFQVSSMFETNENLIKRTFSETSQIFFQGDTDSVPIPEESEAAKPVQYHNQNEGINKQLLGGDILLEDMKKSLLLQEGLYQKVEEELSEMHLVNLQSDVFSKILQETLLEASADIVLTKETIDELSQQLEFSVESKKLLTLKLQKAMEDVQTLNECKASCIVKCSDMALKNQILEAKLESLYNENCLLAEKITEWASLMRECESKYEACFAEKTELANLLKQDTLENGNLQNKISSLKEELKTVKVEYGELAHSKENLQRIVNFLEDKLGSLLASYDKQLNGLFSSMNSVCHDLGLRDFMGIILQLEEIQRSACEKILQLLEEKKNLEDEIDIAKVSLSTAKSDILVMKQKFKHDIPNMVTKLEASNALVEKLQLDLEALSNKLHISSEAEEKYAHQSKELFADLALMEAELHQLTAKNMDLAKEILGLDTVTEELGRSKLTITELTHEKQDLMMSLQDKTEESVKLAAELDGLRESLRFMHDELHIEKSFRVKLEGTIMNLTSQLNEKHDQLLRFSQQETELVHFRQLASDLELEKSRVCHILLQREEFLEKFHEKSSCFIDQEIQLSEMHNYIIAADVEVIFIKSQYENRIEELALQLQSSERHLGEISHCIEEKADLVTTVESLRSELEASIAQNGLLVDLNGVIAVQLEEYKKRVATSEVNFSKEKNGHTREVEQLKHVLEHCEVEIDKLMSYKEELEVTVIVLKSKLNELHAHITSQEECNDELMMLQKHCNELAQRLSEQILKTEEFKNLSIHLKELKDKADAECRQARGKKEPEGPSVAMQESLRIAFIKEQYETRMQELRQQLSISKKHGEEILWKLQDSIDEIENRKKSEASHLKRNEELSLKILELEAELQSLVSEKYEKINTFDHTKAELECALLSLECCREEKQRLEASLHECSEENSRISNELSLMKGQLVSSVSPMDGQKEESDGSDEVGQHVFSDRVLGKAYEENAVAGTPGLESVTAGSAADGSIGIPFCVDRDSLMHYEEVDARSVPIVEGEHSTVPRNAQPVQQDILASESVHGISKHAFVEQVAFPHNDSKHLAVVNDHFKTQCLKSSMDNLHKELERMKSENSLLQQDNHHFDPHLEIFQRELMQLHKANEELRSIFPLFNEFPGNGNALERVLALEVELAETLRAKKRSSILLQSSFLKQHGDEQAIFQSFRDINELIEEMLELKGRYAAVETELKEMHDRYSQLSLQFAEVEGERQKLTMTLKNARTSKNFTHLNAW